MSAKQFEHFMSLQQQLADMRRALRQPKTATRSHRSAAAVAQAKDWLAGNVRGR